MFNNYEIRKKISKEGKSRINKLTDIRWIGV